MNKDKLTKEQIKEELIPIVLQDESVKSELEFSAFKAGISAILINKGLCTSEELDACIEEAKNVIIDKSIEQIYDKMHGGKE